MAIIAAWQIRANASNEWGGIWNCFLFPLLFLTARDKMDTVPIAIIFIFSQRYVLRGIALSGVKG